MSQNLKQKGNNFDPIENKALKRNLKRNPFYTTQSNQEPISQNLKKKGTDFDSIENKALK